MEREFRGTVARPKMKVGVEAGAKDSPFLEYMIGNDDMRLMGAIVICASSALVGIMKASQDESLALYMSVYAKCG